MVAELTGGDAAANRLKAKRKAIAEEIAAAQTRRITKLRIGKSNAIEFLRQTDNGEDERSIVKFEDEIHPDLAIMLNQHRSRAIDALCLDFEMWKDSDVVSIAIKWDGLTILGCAISVRANFEDFQPIVTTPFLRVEMQHCDQIELERLCDEILDCLDGKRSQMSLF